jgi:5,10-methylenetetrahydromethanopterin reductase
VRIGIFEGDSPTKTLDHFVAEARRAQEQGFSSFWMSQIFGPDALTALAIVGREVPDIFLGTGVVPTYPRHPMMLAQQALTVQAATGNRLMLGIGLSHKLVVESIWGLSFDKPVRHMREYLSILGPLLRDGAVDFHGDTLTTSAAVTIPGASAPPVIVAALGTQMLEVAGRLADGTATWMTGPETVRTHTVPTIRSAAKEAGRPDPAIVVSLPVCVTDDKADAISRANELFSIYGTLPSYRAMLDREGAEGPGDIAIVGTEAEVRSRIEQLAEIGATDFTAAEFGSKGEEAEATRALLASMT